MFCSYKVMNIVNLSYVFEVLSDVKNNDKYYWLKIIIMVKMDFIINFSLI